VRLHEQHAAIGKHPDGRRSNVDAVDTEIRLRKIAGNERKDVWSFALSRKKGGPEGPAAFFRLLSVCGDRT
jgi:hypothetical protein